MKVGILTFHRAHNYGAVLQCYALQEVLKSMGHDVSIIDYRQYNIENTYNVLKIDLILRKNLLKSFSYLNKTSKRKRLFENFVSKYIRTTDLISNSSELIPDFDAIVIGSDQLWNIGCTGGVDDFYFGHFNKKYPKIVGYAISGDKKSISIIDKNYIQSSVKNFSALSFREISFASEISLVANQYFPVVIDPTLLLDSSKWSPLINKKWEKRKYIVLYEVKFRAGKEKSLLSIAQKKAKELKCDLIDLSNVEYSPSDFVSIIKYASLVITSSYHATVFSLIFRVPFCTYKLSDGGDERYIDLLEALNMEDCLFNLCQYPSVVYEYVHEDIWITFRQKSINFLKENI